MWIFLTDNFLSIVAHRELPDHLLVWTRKRVDIERVFPEAGVQETRNADYRYRAEILRARVAEVLAAQAQAIDYDNFKNHVNNPARHDAYLGCWSVMSRYQAGAK